MSGLTKYSQCFPNIKSHKKNIVYIYLLTRYFSYDLCHLQ